MSSEPLFSNDFGPNRAVGAPAEVGQLDPRVNWILKHISRAEPKCNAWKTDARQDYRFFAGKQYSDEDMKILEAEQRPANAFNTVQKFIRYVSGVQRDSPITLSYSAIDMMNTQASMFGDTVTQYYQWAVEHTRGDAQRSRIFTDHLVCGMGWEDGYISHAVDARGLVALRRLSPFEMLWPECPEQNLGSSQEGCPRWLARETYVENEEAKALFPDEYAQNLIDMNTGGMPMTSWPSVDNVPYIIPYVQTVPLDKLSYKRTEQKDKSRIMQFQWWDNELGYVFEDPLDQTEQFMTVPQFREYQSQLKDNFKVEIETWDRTIGRKWMKAFLLNRRYLLEDPSPLPGNRFTFSCMCTHWEEDSKRWYGFERVLIDPQRYANKFFNQMIEVMAKQAKAGVMAEADAFEDKAQQKDFLDTYSQAGSVNIVAQGGLAKIKEKGLPQTPAAAMAILQFCIDSMGKYLTGINEDSLGIGASTSAGVAIKRRQRAGMVLLAPEFDSESQFRKDEARVVYDLLKLIPDNRLIRVQGLDGGGQVIRLEGAPFSLEYEIELDEVERDPNMKQWLGELIMGPFGQTMMRMNLWIPEFWNVLPIPRRWIETIKQKQEAMQKQAQEDAAKGLPPPGGRGAKKSLIELQAMVENKKADTALRMAKAAALVGKGKIDESKLMFDILKQQFEEYRQNQMHDVDATKQIVDMTKTASEIGQDQGGGGMAQ